MNYVLGFAMTEDSVALIHKQRPDWQKGFINGIGGKTDLVGELPVDAMSREFEEETGVEIPYRQWDHFATMEWGGGSTRVYCFKAEVDAATLAFMRKTTDEQPCIIRFDDMDQHPLIGNLHFLIAMARFDKYSKIPLIKYDY